jgi:hypothetical protein
MTGLPDLHFSGSPIYDELVANCGDLVFGGGTAQLLQQRRLFAGSPYGPGSDYGYHVGPRSSMTYQAPAALPGEPAVPDPAQHAPAPQALPAEAGPAPDAETRRAGRLTDRLGAAMRELRGR